MRAIEYFILTTLRDLKRKKLVLIITFVAFVLSLLMFPTKLVLAKMLPGKSDNTFSVYVDTPNGSSIHETKQVTDCIIGLLNTEKEVTDMEVFLSNGAPLDYAGLIKGSGFKQEEHQAEIVVNLTDKHSRSETSFAMVHRLRPEIAKQCGSIIKDTNIKMIEQPAGPPTLASIVIELYGDEDALAAPALEIAKILSKTPGLVDVDIQQDEIFKKFKLIVNKEKIIRSELSIEQVNKILYLAFEGMAISVKNTPNYPSQIPLYLVLSRDTKSLEASSKGALLAKLSGLKLMNKNGQMVPIVELVDVEETLSQPIITSKNLKTMVNIIAETDLVSQVYPLLDARSRIKYELSKSYEITSGSLFDLNLKDRQTGKMFRLVWDGEMKVTMDTFRDLGAAFIAALVLIFLLMVIYYKSFILSGIVLLGSFLSIIGVIVGHFIMDLFTSDTFFLTATSLIGFIALMGISSRNSLLLIDFTKSLILDKGIEKKRAIAVATATRSKPIFLTAAAIILASTLLAGDPIFGGLGVALIFGTIASVAVSLIFIPVLMDNTQMLDKKNLLKQRQDA